MTWVILLAGVVVVCFVAALVLGLVGAGASGGLGSGARALSHEPLPDEPIADTDFDDLVFDVGLRGYRMSQVDGVLDRLRRELREKDEEIAVLRRGAPHPVDGSEPAP
ncbi:MAG: DivIVA domain [Humibacillus sp.]|nr:DivIVA domain [Humibacillus sp.]